MKLIRRRLEPLSKLIILVLPFVLFFIHCGPGQIKKIYLEGTKDLNKGGNACYVCIYQLIDDMEFMRTPLESFWRQGEKPFEGDLADKNVVCRTLIPGDLEDLIDLEILDETNFIGVAADFRDPDQERWRQVYEIPSHRPKQIQIIVESNSVRIEAYYK